SGYTEKVRLRLRRHVGFGAAGGQEGHCALEKSPRGWPARRRIERPCRCWPWHRTQCGSDGAEKPSPNSAHGPIGAVTLQFDGTSPDSRTRPPAPSQTCLAADALLQHERKGWGLLMQPTGGGHRPLPDRQGRTLRMICDATPDAGTPALNFAPP